MSSSIKYEFFMSQIKHIKDVKEDKKTKISIVFFNQNQSSCILRICKNRDLSNICQALMKKTHPNIVVVYDYVFENGNTYILEENISGKTIEELLDEKGVFSETEVAKIVIDICNGLNFLHKKQPPLIHNDINTSNIMIRDDGCVKLFDFDISRTYKKGVNKNTVLFGTEEYASPEHFGYGQSEPRTDIYSLGVTMHKMLTDSSLSNEHKITYVGKLKKIIKKCIEIDPKKRYASVFSLKKDLEKYINRRKRYLYRFVSIVIILFLFILPFCFDFQEAPKDEVSKDNNEKTTEVSDIVDTNFENSSDKINEDSNSSEESYFFDDLSEKNKNNSSEKKMINKYKLAGDLKSMEVLNDGTFVYLEEMPDGCYLKTSFGEDYLIKNCAGSYTRDLIYDNYSNTLYLLARDMNSSQYELYSFDKKFNARQIATLRAGDRTISGTYNSDLYASFFSDATMYCDVLDNQFMDSKNWSDVNSINFSVFSITNDKLYQLNQDNAGNNFLQEIDFENNVINEYEIPFEIEEDRWRSIIYNNNKNIFFEGRYQNKDYIYKFDGENFEELVCLNDYKYYTSLPYGDWCVTENAIWMYDIESNTIKEFELN